MCGYPKTAGVRYKAIPNFPEYIAGDDGSIWSRNHHKTQWGKEHGPFRELKHGRTQAGYHTVMLWRDGKGYGPLLVQRLILETFVGPCPKGMEACHENDDKDDLRLSNLRWGTRSFNMQDAIRNGRTTKGERNARAILMEDDVLEIRRLYATGKYYQRELGEMFGVVQQTIFFIVNRINWTHI